MKVKPIIQTMKIIYVGCNRLLLKIGLAIIGGGPEFVFCLFVLVGKCHAGFQKAGLGSGFSLKNELS